MPMSALTFNIEWHRRKPFCTTCVIVTDTERRTAIYNFDIASVEPDDLLRKRVDTQSQNGQDGAHACKP